MKLLQLSGGKVSRVNNDVYRWASQKRWTAQRRKHTWHAARYEGKKYVYLHRLILHATVGEEIDHRDGDGLNNLRRNLRKVTHAENQRAFRTPWKTKTSRYRGVCWHRIGRKWMARLRFMDKEYYFGLFASEIAAAQARDKAARRIYGAVAQLNFPV